MSFQPFIHLSLLHSILLPNLQWLEVGNLEGELAEAFVLPKLVDYAELGISYMSVCIWKIILPWLKTINIDKKLQY